MARWEATPEGKAARRRAKARYRRTQKNRAAQKRYRETDKGKAQRCANQKAYAEAHPEQIQAQHAVNHAVERGEIGPARDFCCVYCGQQADEYHHWHGYAEAHWMDVVPVCFRCHHGQSPAT